MCVMNPSFLLTTLLSASLFFTTSTDTFRNNTTVTFIDQPTSAAAFSTGWEAVPEWKSNETNGVQVYNFNRNTPELNDAVLNGGAVVVFAKGYDFEGFSRSAEKPMGLPFYIMSANENANDTYNWTTDNTEGNIAVSLKMSKDLAQTFSKAQGNIRFRYFVLPQAFLQAHHLTTQALHQMPYHKFTELVGIAN